MMVAVFREDFKNKKAYEVNRDGAVGFCRQRWSPATTKIFVPVGGCWPARERCDAAFPGLEACVRFYKWVTVLLNVFTVFTRDTVEAFTFDCLWNNEIIFIASGFDSPPHTIKRTYI